MATLYNIEVEDFLKDSVAIKDNTPLVLQEEFMRAPVDLAYWNERFVQALKRFQGAKIGCERINARLHLEMKERLTASAKASVADTDGKKSTVKAPTVGDIESAVELDAEYIAARDLVTDTECEKARIWGVVEAIKMKRDMLIQLGSHTRVEMQNDPMLRDEVRSAREFKAGR
jgi:hypothetical protein